MLSNNRSQPLSGDNPPQSSKLNIGDTLNILGLLGISVSLVIAFYYQLFQHELPCPLCLLQRVGMITIGFGFLMNVRFGIRSAHYGIALLGSLLTGAIASRQVFLHILPGDPGYGVTLMGLHFYTWAVVSALASMVFISGLLLLKSWEQPSSVKQQTLFLGKLSIVIFILLIAANLVSTLLECGLGECEANPTYYQLLNL
ncbi:MULTISPECIES: disulfide bond formation protein B [Pseudomonas]|uniref:disulfide bond formation protein B n=1 Tax=Pseudomonas TaxID=286 RepID=UPI000B35BA0F|nr:MULTISPECIES: disulfide bond formation protein B [Pseudomonas]PMY33065.1 disulfide bond formation protein B [Pseudomonas sp. GW456-L14]PMY50013.1 disulfide bond formation protein B [Pseudomonas sp. GW456-L12]PMY64844.1 disulfide bond formation protein B [Pseudomonas sp. FW305-25]PMY69236.1 disulfide bond formation protein B [Pseudomonas sp. FW126-L8]PNA80075.1 disulfide bond formation protein B [Pseudomonas sp. FW305-76]